VTYQNVFLSLNTCIVKESYTTRACVEHRVGLSHISTFANGSFLLFSKVLLHFLFALLKSGIVPSHFLSLFSKVRMWDCTFCRTFQKYKKGAIAQSLFWKERMCDDVGKKGEFSISLFLLFNKSDCTFPLLKRAYVQKWAKKCDFQIALFSLFHSHRGYIAWNF